MSKRAEPQVCVMELAALTPAANFVADLGEGKVKDELEFTGDFGLAVAKAYARARGAK